MILSGERICSQSRKQARNGLRITILTKDPLKEVQGDEMSTSEPTGVKADI
ncbi:hypothetical protein A2U01_0102837, partial [Trifolium medium]|nr:hypothetical protein [Trifolium medium]